MKNLRMPANMAFIGIVSTKLGIFNAIMAFVITGAIPGTSLYIPSSFMLLATITGLWLMALWFILPPLVKRQTLQVTKPARTHDIVQVDTVVYSSRQPDFRLFGPVVHVGR